VVDEDHALRDPQGVVVWQRDDPRAELDPLRLRGDVGDERERVDDQLAAAGVVLAEPHLVEPEHVVQLDQLDVAPECEIRVLGVGQVERRMEDAEAHSGSLVARLMR
jgi:hypothetical protein